MIRTLAIATVAAIGFTAPALAADTATDSTQAAAVTAQIASDRAADQVRHQLAGQGYTNISGLERGDDGRWTGFATKDGKTVLIGVDMPRPQPTVSN